MKTRMAVVIISFLLSINVFGATSKEQWCEIAVQDRELYLKYPETAPYVPPTSNVVSPFDEKMPFSNVPTGKIADSLSGYYCDSMNNHPLIYGSSKGFTVSGRGYRKEFSKVELEKALSAYQELLVSTGYIKKVSDDLWLKGAKSAYIDRCASSMESQGLPKKNAKAYCSCTTNGMESEFGMKEYKEMMKANADPNGNEYDIRLYNVLVSCKHHLP